MRLQQQLEQAITVASDHRDRAVILAQKISTPDDRFLNTVKCATSRLGFKQIDRLVAGLAHARGEIRIRRLTRHHHPPLHPGLPRRPRNISRKRQSLQKPLILIARRVVAHHPRPQNKKTRHITGTGGRNFAKFMFCTC